MKWAAAGLTAIVLDSALPSIPPGLSPFSPTELFAKDGSYASETEELKKQLTKDVLSLIKRYSGKKTAAYYECIKTVSGLEGLLADGEEISKTIDECKKATPVVVSAETRKGFAQDYNKIAKKYAEKFANLAKDYPSFKDEALSNALRLDENNKTAREVLGEEFVLGYWMKSDIAKHYKKGEREVDGKWISKKEADEIHKDWKKPWILKSKHFEIRTNARESKEEKDGTEIITKSGEEVAIDMLQQAEEAYSAIETELGRVLELNKQSSPLTINYYNKIVDYARNIPEEFQSYEWIGAVGFRDFRANKSILYLRKEIDSDDPVDAIVEMRSLITCYFIEKLLKNLKMRKTTIPNYWATEGLCSLTEAKPKTICPGICEIGEIHKGWLDYYKSMSDDRFKPLKEIIAVYSPTRDIQAQGWGLSHYLFHAENGRHRYNFIKLLGKVCTGEAKEEDFKGILVIDPDDKNYQNSGKDFNKIVIEYIKSQSSK